MAAAPRPEDVPQVSRRRFRHLNLTLFLPLLTAVGAYLIARQAQTWPQGLILGLGLAAALVAFVRWSAGRLAAVAAPCLVVAGAIWCYGVFAFDSQSQGAFYSIAIVGSLVVPQLPRHRLIAAAGVVLFVAAVGVAGVLTIPAPDVGDLIADVIVPTGFTAVVIGLMFPNKTFYDVVAELEESRDRDAELAVVRERIRFAGDLHDIQGHTLHVVKLKVALAQKLMHSDPDRAEQELREVHDLVGDTIAQTRELVYGQRKLNLTAELENARNLLEAAGIRVGIARRDGVAVCANELLAQVLRETTTNILRHSRARSVQISLTANSISVTNDGVTDSVMPELRGLATLASRVSDQNGELTVTLEDGRFRTAATFPDRSSDRVTPETAAAQQ
ncbi:Sensor histidine kinase [Mycobacterium sp. smrl_JER01]